MQLEWAISYSNFLIPYFLLLPKLLCAWKQWYQARVYDLATEMARRKEVSYAILLHAGILSATVTLFIPTYAIC